MSLQRVRSSGLHPTVSLELGLELGDNFFMAGSSRVSRSQARAREARTGLSWPGEQEEKVYKGAKLKNQEPQGAGGQGGVAAGR